MPPTQFLMPDLLSH